MATDREVELFVDTFVRQQREENVRRSADQANVAAWLASRRKLSTQQALQARQLATKTGQSQDWVIRNLDDVAAFESQKQLSSSLARTPALQRVMQQPGNAQLVEDDVANLEGLAWWIGGPASRLEDWLDEMSFSAFTALEMAGLGSPENRRNIALTLPELNKTYGADNWFEKAVIEAPSFLTEGGLEVGARIGGGALGSLAAGPAGIAIGQHLGGTAFDFAQTVGPLYWRLQNLTDESGAPLLTEEEARVYALVGAGATSSITALLFGGAARRLPGVGKFLQGATTNAVAAAAGTTVRRFGRTIRVGKALANAAKEHGIGVASASSAMAALATGQQLTEEVARLAEGGQPVSWDRVGQVAQQGFVDGFHASVLAMGIRPTSSLLRNVSRVSRSTTDAQSLEEIDRLADESTLKESDPDLFRETVATLKQSGHTDAYVEIDRWNEVVSARGLEPSEVAANVLGDGGRSYQEAVASGSPLTIPMEDYLEALSGLNLLDDLRPATRLSEDGYTLEQLQTFEQSALERSKEARQSRAIYDDVYEKATLASASHEEADASAQLFQSAFDTQARLFNEANPGSDMTGEGLYQSMVELEIHGPEGRTEPEAQPEEPQVTTRLTQGGRGPNRGFVQFSVGGTGRRRFSIHLLETADFSTLAHETSHVLGEIFADLAARRDAPEQLRADNEALLRFLGYDSPEERRQAVKQIAALSAREGNLDQAGRIELTELTKREEKLASAFETYLSEGRAPSRELRSVFQRFKAWFSQIIQSARALFRDQFGEDLELTDEVRGIFQRMLATTEATQAANESMQVEAVPEIAALMTEAQRADYEAQAAQVATESEAELLRRIREVARRDNAAWFRRERDRIQGEVDIELDTDPAHRALAYFQKGTWEGDELPDALISPDGGPYKLNRGQLSLDFGVETMQRLANRGLVSRDGESLGAMAELLRFGSPQQMVEALSTVAPRREAVRTEAQRRLKEAYGALLEDPKRLTETAIEGAESSRHGQKIIREINALAKAAGVRAPDLTMDRLIQAATQIVQLKRVSQIRPDTYLRSQRAAARRMRQAIRAGKTEKALQAAQQQAWSLALYRAAKDARQQVDEATRRLRSFGQANAQQRLGLAGQEYRTAMNLLLEALGLRPTQGTGRKRVQAFRAFQQQESANLRDVLVTDRLLTLLERPPQLRDLMVQDLMEVRNAAISINHAARLRRSALSRQERVDFDASVNALTSAIGANRGFRTTAAATPEARTPFQKLVNLGDWALSSLIRPQVMLRDFDAGDPDGPATRMIWDPIQAGSTLADDIGQSSLTPILTHLKKQPRSYGKHLREHIHIKAVGKTFARENLIMAMSHYGSESGTRRLRDGNGVTDGAIQEMGAHLTQADVELVRVIWRTLEPLGEQQIAQEARLTGVPPGEVQPKPFRITLQDGTTAEMEGGYVPIKLQFAEGRGTPSVQVEGGDVPQLFGGAYARSLTSQGNLIERQEHSRPIDLTLTRLPQHITQVSQDIALREPLISAWRLLHNDQVSQAIIDSRSEHSLNMLRKWVQEVANSNAVPDNGTGLFDRFLQASRRGLVGAVFAFNVGQWLQNLSGTLIVFHRAKQKQIAIGAMKEYMRRPKSTHEWIARQSGEMRHRTISANRDIAEAERNVDLRRNLIGTLQVHPSRVEQTLAAGRAMWHSTDTLVSDIGWLTGYRDAKEAGASHEAAVRAGDAFVDLNVFAGRQKDLPAILRTRGMLRTLTMFMTWVNGMFNQLVMSGQDARRRWHDGEQVQASLDFARTFGWVVATMLLGEAIMGDLPEDYDEDDEIDAADTAVWVRNQALAVPFMGIPFASQTAQAVQTGFDPDFAPHTRAFEEAAKTIRAAGRVAGVGEDTDESAVLDLFDHGLRTFGWLRGLPVVQADATFGYFHAMANDDGSDETLDIMTGLALGKDESERIRAVIESVE